MKKFMPGLITFCIFFMFVGCATEKPATAAQGGLPQWVVNARTNAPEDVIVGIGAARMATINQSMNISETRARTQIIRAMNSMVDNMITDYNVGSEADLNASLAFQEEITRALARANVSGARIVEQNADPNGMWFTVVYFNRAETTRELNTAASAVRQLAPHANAAFSALERMDEAFDRAAAQEWIEF
jgi:hypothetical protein